MSPDDFMELLEDAADASESGSLREPLHDCVPLLYEGFETNFLRAEGPNGEQWPARKDDLPHPLLILSGDLIEAARDTGNPDNLLQVGDRDLVTGIAGAGVPYAATHNYGRDWGRGSPIPQREYLYANEEVLDACEDVLADGMIDVMFGS